MKNKGLIIGSVIAVVVVGVTAIFLWPKKKNESKLPTGSAGTAGATPAKGKKGSKLSDVDVAGLVKDAGNIISALSKKKDDTITLDDSDRAAMDKAGKSADGICADDFNAVVELHRTATASGAHRHRHTRHHTGSSHSVAMPTNTEQSSERKIEVVEHRAADGQSADGFTKSGFVDAGFGQSAPYDLMQD